MNVSRTRDGPKKPYLENFYHHCIGVLWFDDGKIITSIFKMMIPDERFLVTVRQWRCRMWIQSIHLGLIIGKNEFQGCLLILCIANAFWHLHSFTLQKELNYFTLFMLLVHICMVVIWVFSQPFQVK